MRTSADLRSFALASCAVFALALLNCSSGGAFTADGGQAADAADEAPPIDPEGEAGHATSGDAGPADDDAKADALYDDAAVEASSPQDPLDAAAEASAPDAVDEPALDAGNEAAPDGDAGTDAQEGGTVAVPPTVSPGSATLGILHALAFTASVPVTWSIQEGAVGGSIDGTGKYIAPATPGTYHVVATSTVDSQTATASVDVVGLGLTIAAGVVGGPGNIDGPAAQAHFRVPGGTAYTQNGLLLADMLNGTIRRYDASTNLVSTLAGTAGVTGTADGVGPAAEFNEPATLVADYDTGQTWVLDSGNHCIRSIDATTGAVTTYAGTCGDSGHADGALTAALFQSPEEMILGPRGTALYLCDYGTAFTGMRRIDLTTGQVSSMLVNSGCANLVADTLNERVYFVRDDLNGDGEIVYFDDPASGSPGATPATTVLVDPTPGAFTVGGLAVAAYYPSGTGQWTLFGLGDSQPAVYEDVVGSPFDSALFSGSLTQHGTTDGPVADARFEFATYLDAVPQLGFMYASDETANDVRVFDLQNSTVNTALGSHETMQSVDGALGQGRIMGPWAITTDPAGNAYVTDVAFGLGGVGSNIIRRIDSTGTLTTLAGAPGNSSPTTVPVDGPAASATFGTPIGITYAGGTLYVVDLYGNAIRAVSVATGAVTTLAGKLGVAGASNGVGTAAEFSFYASSSVNQAWGGGITTDGTNLYVADSGNYAIRQIAIATGAVTTVAGGTMGSQNGTGTNARFQNPFGIAYDRGTLYVADAQDDTIRAIDVATGATSTVVGLSGVRVSADGDATTATFAGPYAITADGLGNLFVAEGFTTSLTNANWWEATPGVVRRVDLATRTVTTLAGTRGQNGVVPGPAPSTLNCPTGLAMTPGGDLLTADECDGVVVLISAQ